MEWETEFKAYTEEDQDFYWCDDDEYDISDSDLEDGNEKNSGGVPSCYNPRDFYNEVDDKEFKLTFGMSKELAHYIVQKLDITANPRKTRLVVNFCALPLSSKSSNSNFS